MRAASLSLETEIQRRRDHRVSRGKELQDGMGRTAKPKLAEIKVRRPLSSRPEGLLSPLRCRTDRHLDRLDSPQLADTSENSFARERIRRHRQGLLTAGDEVPLHHCHPTGLKRPQAANESRNGNHLFIAQLQRKTEGLIQILLEDRSACGERLKQRTID